MITFCVFYDPKGVVHNYFVYYVKALTKLSKKVVVIVNGEIASEGKELLINLGCDVMVRQNVGFDFSAWGEAFVKYYESLADYDHLLLTNGTCYGPIFPLNDILEKMNGEEFDFWGLYRYPKITDDIVSHIQSYFMVLNKGVFLSNWFREYLKSVKVANTWLDATRQEISFTRDLETAGFRSGAFIDSCELIANPSIYDPLSLIKQGFPFVKRKVFSESAKDLLNNSCLDQAVSVIEYLENLSDYPVDYIYQDLCYRKGASDITLNLHLNYVLDSKSSSKIPSNRRISMILYSYYEDLIEFNISHINNLPEGTAVYVVTVFDDLVDKWERSIEKYRLRNISIRKQENRGRNEAAYWLTCKDVIRNSDYVCLAHDKKSPAAYPRIRGFLFSEHCWSGILESEDYVRNVIDTFEKNDRIGLLIPYTPILAGYYDVIFDNEWSINKKIAQEVYQKLKLSVPFDEHPLAPWGAMFWVRSKAMEPLFRYKWTVEDFPIEPIKIPDGTVLHALERMYPMIAQEAGYFTGQIISSTKISLYYDNLYRVATAKYADYNKMLVTGCSGDKVSTKQLICVIGLYLKQKFRRIFRRRL